MAALANVDHLALVYHWPDVAVLLSRLGKRQEAVDACQQRGVDLYLRDIFLNGRHQVVEELAF